VRAERRASQLRGLGSHQELDALTVPPQPHSPGGEKFGRGLKFLIASLAIPHDVTSDQFRIDPEQQITVHRSRRARVCTADTPPAIGHTSLITALSQATATVLLHSDPFCSIWIGQCRCDRCAARGQCSECRVERRRLCSRISPRGSTCGSGDVALLVALDVEPYGRLEWGVLVLRVSESCRRLLPYVAFAAVGLFWGESNYLKSTSRALAVMATKRHSPVLLAGLRLDPASTLQPPIDWSAQQNAKNDKLVLIVTSDDCSFCRQAEAAMCGFLRSGSMPAKAGLVLVSFGGREIPDRLARCAAEAGVAGPAAISNVTAKLAFSVRTGILATPSVLVLDSDGTLVGSCAGGDLARCPPLIRAGQPRGR